MSRILCSWHPGTEGSLPSGPVFSVCGCRCESDHEDQEKEGEKTQHDRCLGRSRKMLEGKSARNELHEARPQTASRARAIVPRAGLRARFLSVRTTGDANLLPRTSRAALARKMARTCYDPPAASALTAPLHPQRNGKQSWAVHSTLQPGIGISGSVCFIQTHKTPTALVGVATSRFSAHIEAWPREPEPQHRGSGAGAGCGTLPVFPEPSHPERPGLETTASDERDGIQRAGKQAGGRRSLRDGEPPAPEVAGRKTLTEQHTTHRSPSLPTALPEAVGEGISEGHGEREKRLSRSCMNLRDCVARK